MSLCYMYAQSGIGYCGRCHCSFRTLFFLKLQSNLTLSRFSFLCRRKSHINERRRRQRKPLAFLSSNFHRNKCLIFMFLRLTKTMIYAKTALSVHDVPTLSALFTLQIISFFQTFLMKAFSNT